MTQFVFANNVNTTLASPVSNTATSITLASSANLPTLSAGQVMPLTCNDAATGQTYEIMYVTAISGPTLTVTRAQEGTGAQNWNTGDYAFCAFTAQGTASATGNPNNAFMTGPATSANQAPQFGQISGVVGTTRNLSMSVTAASATATLTADEIIVETALGGLRYCLPSFSKTINLATTGAGGMDAGSAPPGGTVGIYAIYNPTTGASALLGVNESTYAARLPSTYPGSSMPAGYTASALVSVWTLNSSSQFAIGYQLDRMVWMQQIMSASITTQISTLTALTLAIPYSATRWHGWGAITSTNGAAAQINVSGDANNTGKQQAPGGVTASSGAPSSTTGAPLGPIPLITPKTVYWDSFVNSGTFINSSLQTSGYEF